MASQVQQPMLASCIYQPQLPAVNPVIVPALAVQVVATKSKHLKYIRIIQRVSLAQGLLGIFCLMIGIWSAFARFDLRHTVYEGIWCGFWIAFCGIFGYIGIGQKASRYVINIHFAFSIVGVVMSGTLVSFSVTFALKDHLYQVSILTGLCNFPTLGCFFFAYIVAWTGVIFLSLAAVFSLVSLVLLITNAIYTSFLNETCQQCGNDGGYNNRIICTQQSIPVQAAGTVTFQPVYSAQGYQPIMATTQVGYAQSALGQMTPTPYNQNLPKADAPNPVQSAATSSGLQEGIVHQPVYVAQRYQPIMAGVQVGYAQSAPDQMTPNPSAQNSQKQQQDEDNRDERSTPSTESPACDNFDANDRLIET